MASETVDVSDKATSANKTQVAINVGDSLKEQVCTPPESSPFFGSLSNDTPETVKGEKKILEVEGEDDEQPMPKSFPRTSSPISTSKRNRGAEYQKVGEAGVCKMHRFSLYETAAKYYLVGGDIIDNKFRILKIDRTTEALALCVTEDDIVYTKKEMNQLLNAVDDGNKASGGLKLKCSTWGLLGFIRFTGAYYMMLITKRSQVAVIGGHYVYQVDGTELVSLAIASTTRNKAFDNEESRFVSILHSLDLSRSFYFSYSYDITRSLQDNIYRERMSLRAASHRAAPKQHNPMFVWNHHLLDPARKVLRNTYDWCIPIIHGFVDQATLSVYGRTVHIAIVARRSRFFAGARFLKRGVNDLGYVANDVETEQIVAEMLTTSLHAPGPDLFANPNYTSYVQHRGSIPLYWTQDKSGVSPKPEIDLNLVDPFYTSAALHFDNLFDRYGAPVYVLNLIKARERTPRESILLDEYSKAITYLNQFLPRSNKIKYRAWDMSRASKSHDQDVIGTLETIAEDVVRSTGFFHNNSAGTGTAHLQNGIARTNCIDCLDRTNAAQFVIGKRALGHQLHALGIIDNDSLDYDTDAVNLFTHMFHDHGDTIAIQYGGSHLVNTMETYRKINQWSSHSRDMVESFKRYYNNSFLDKQRQEAYNLFLGNYTYMQGQPMLWDLSTDYYLHNAHPKAWSPHRSQRYTHWYHSKHLLPRTMPTTAEYQVQLRGKPLGYYDDYWLENYRPVALSSFTKIFSFKMNSTLRYIPFKSTKEGKYDLSPFRIRDKHEHPPLEKSHARKEVSLLEPGPDNDQQTESTMSKDMSSQGADLPAWLQNHLDYPQHQAGITNDVSKATDNTLQASALPREKKQAKDKAAITQWTLNQFVNNSLNPSVTLTEAHEYQRYINHPQQLPLVVSTDLPASPTAELVYYVNSVASGTMTELHPSDDDVTDFTEFLDVVDDPLTVIEADAGKKRYKAYRQWVKGKSLFKQRVES